jgi:ActR/RegA family two-component response regulator
MVTRIEDRLPESPTARPHGRGRVVVLHADGAYRRRLAAVLARDGFEPHDLRRPDELLDLVIEKIRDDPFAPLADALVLDAQIDGIYGLGLVVALRKYEPAMRVVLLSEFRDFAAAATRSLGGVTVLPGREDPEVVRAALGAAFAANGSGGRGAGG